MIGSVLNFKAFVNQSNTDVSGGGGGGIILQRGESVLALIRCDICFTGVKNNFEKIKLRK